MNKKPLLSIGIPAYNNRKYLSLLLETLSKIIIPFKNEIEILIVDDGSTDDTQNIISNYSDKFVNLKIIKQKNQGLSASRDVITKNINGKYLWSIDADDLIDNDAFTEIFKIIKNNPNVEIINLNYIIFHSDGYFNNHKSKIQDATKCKINFAFPTVWSKVFKASLLSNIVYGNKLPYEDLRTTFNIYAKANLDNILSIKKPVLFYRIRKDSIMRINDDKFLKIKEVLDIASKNLSFIQKKTLYQIHLIVFNSFHAFKFPQWSYKDQKKYVSNNLKFMKTTFGKKSLKISQKKQLGFQIKIGFWLIKYRLFLIFKIFSKFSNRD